MIDNELMEALHAAFYNHLRTKQEMPAHSVIATLLAYVVSELSYGIFHNPKDVEHNKKQLINAFKMLVEEVKPQKNGETFH